MYHWQWWRRGVHLPNYITCKSGGFEKSPEKPGDYDLKPGDFKNISKICDPLVVGRIAGAPKHPRLSDSRRDTPRDNILRGKPKPWVSSTGQTIATRQRNTLLRCVATCWVLLAQVWKWSNRSQQHPTSRNTSQQAGQTHATCCAQQCCDMLRWYVAIVWPGLR